MNRSPWFTFYADDWKGGTAGMTLAAKGAYIDLLAYQFHHGPIPDDPRTICRILGCFPDEWEPISSEVLGKFERVENGWENARMRHEIEVRETRSKNGKKGGRPPSPEKLTESKTKANGKLNGKLNHNQTQSPTTTTTVLLEKEPKGAAAGPPLPFSSDGFRLAWDEYIAYRRESKFRKLKPASIAKQFREFEEWGEPTAIEAINNTIRNGHQGIFYPSGQRGGSPSHRPTQRINRNAGTLNNPEEYS